MSVLRRLDLCLTFRNGAQSARFALLAGMGFGLFMAMADMVLFASAVPEVQRYAVTQVSLGGRLAHYLRGAAIDEVQFRLIAMTGLIWLLSHMPKAGGKWQHWTSLSLAALVVYPLMNMNYISYLDWSVLTFARELVLHGGAGMLWGWLYWKHGWLAGLTGHMGAHLTLQPLLGLTA